MDVAATISVVIPALNEAEYLPETLKAVFSEVSAYEHLREVIVVDAGSDDGTIEAIEKYDVRVFSRPEFAGKKYESLNFGLSRASGDVVLFLDADTKLPQEYDLHVFDALKNEKTVGGAFEFSFDKTDRTLRIIQLINQIRYRFGHIFYGDQAVFCRREVAMALEGYPPRQLMESAYFCKQLRQKGKLKLVRARVRTSSRRFVTYGIFRVLFFDACMWALFVLGADVSKYGTRYWNMKKSN